MSLSKLCGLRPRAVNSIPTVSRNRSRSSPHLCRNCSGALEHTELPELAKPTGLVLMTVGSYCGVLAKVLASEDGKIYHMFWPIAYKYMVLA